MTEIIIPIITGIVCLAVGVVIGFLYRKSVAEKAIGDAETEATRIINEAIKAGETKKRESVLEAKDEIHRQRVEADRQLKRRSSSSAVSFSARKRSTRRATPSTARTKS
mgnify:CR=1 FL=1